MGTKRIDRSQTDIAIGAAIRRGRTRAGLTQEALAAALDVTYQQVQNYEKGSGRISAASLKMISDLLDVAIESMFDDDGSGGDPGPCGPETTA